MKVAVASGKGGTGKTTLSSNLAAFLAEEKKFNSVTLADLDVEEPNSGLFIRGRTMVTEEKYKYVPEWDKQKCTNCGLCGRLCKFNAVLQMGKTIMILPELCHSCYACSELCPADALPMKKNRMGEIKIIETEEGIRFFESRLDVGREQAVPLIAQSIEYIGENSDPDGGLVLFDSPPGTSCPVIEVAKNSDFIILVTEPTPFGLHDLMLAVEAMREIKKSFAVVINRWGIGNDAVAEYCDENNVEIIAKFPNMRKIAEIYSDGKLIFREVPEFRTELAKVADYLLNINGSRSINGRPVL